MDLEKLQQILDDLPNMENLPLPVVTETISKSIGGRCSSGMPRPPRAGGITTPKEYSSIFNAIAFSKLYKLFITDELIWTISGIKKTNNSDNNRRVSSLISSIIELSQIYEDVFTDNRRKIKEDEEGIYIQNPDGSIDKDEVSIKLLQRVDFLRSEHDIYKMIEFMVSIGYKDHAKYHFIPTLLSLSSVLGITNEKFNQSNPLFLYRIEPYMIVKNNFGIDVKHDAMMRRWFDHVLDNGLDEDRVFDLKSLKTKVGTLVGYAALRHFPKYKRNLPSSRAVKMHGEHLFRLYLATATKKNGFVGARNISLRFFTEGTSLVNFHTDFFKKEKVYMKNWHYLVYVPTHEMNMVAEEVFDFIKTLKFKEPEDEYIRETNNVFSFDFEKLMEVNVRDRMNILAHSIGVKDGKVWVDIGTKDDGFNRVYSLMTHIGSESRLGLIEYDMGTAQQTIMMNIVNNWEDYPLHSELINNKKVFRNKISDIIGGDYEAAKQTITAINNGRKLTFYKREKQKQLLKPYQEEAEKLANDFMCITKENHKCVYIMAAKKAKKAESDEEVSIYGKKFYSHLTHTYTYFERQIREAMKSCFTQPVYDVHDAVYSREILDPQVLVDAVLEQTGYKVSIERGELPQDDSE